MQIVRPQATCRANPTNKKALRMDEPPGKVLSDTAQAVAVRMSAKRGRVYKRKKSLRFVTTITEKLSEPAKAFPNCRQAESGADECRAGAVSG